MTSIMRGGQSTWHKATEFSVSSWLRGTSIVSGGFNSLTPGGFEWNLRYLIFKLRLVTDDWGISFEISFRWVSLDLVDD